MVDASIFPTLPSGNINFPTMMVAERVSDLILDERSKLAPVAQSDGVVEPSPAPRPNKPDFSADLIPIP
ncbi:hypothetical protein D9M69_517580 [compost metagenome]